MDDLISIVVPTYNCEKYILETLKSIKSQTYRNFEVLIIDDCSTDNTYNTIKDLLQEDCRFIYHRLEVNSGAAIARNTAVEMSKGSFIAFIDSDDLWVEYKLEKQIKFMKDNNYPFTATQFGRIDQNGIKLKWVSKYIKVRNYNKLLKRSPGNSTVMYNANVLGKTYIPNIRKRNDYVMWLSIIKKSKSIYEINEVMSYYRIREDSLSRNKKSLLKFQWNVYRDIEKLSLFKSTYLMCWFIVRGVLKLK